MKWGCMAAGLLALFVALLASMMLVVPVRAFALRVGMVVLLGALGFLAALELLKRILLRVRRTGELSRR